MVIIRILLAASLCSSFAAAAVTADQLRGGADDKNREATLRQSRANTGALGDLLPQKSNKYGGAPAASKRPSAAKPKDGAAKAATQPPAVDTTNIYIPRPSAAPTGAAVVSDAVKPTVAFGIRLGSWLSASLNRNTTNADSGTVELTLTADAIGDRRTLPAGSTLFAEKALNSATKRLEMTVTHGITPSGIEFELRGIVFDPAKTPGLAGVYVVDKKDVASKGIARGILAAGGAAVSTLGGGTIAGAATNAATQSVLNDANQVTEINSVQAIIYVAPQPLIIRIERQF